MSRKIYRPGGESLRPVPVGRAARSGGPTSFRQRRKGHEGIYAGREKGSSVSGFTGKGGGTILGVDTTYDPSLTHHFFRLAKFFTVRSSKTYCEEDLMSCRPSDGRGRTKENQPFIQTLSTSGSGQR